MRRHAMWLGVASLLAVAGPARAQEVIEYYGIDALGSVRVVFDATGTVVGRTDYVPFGDALNPSGALPPEQFTGQERHGDAGLDYFGARYYAARFGRFSTVDPVSGNPMDPQSWNRYAYARNAPGTFIDPTGMTITCTDKTNLCQESIAVIASAPAGGGGSGIPTISPIRSWFGPTSLVADIERDGNKPEGDFFLDHQNEDGYWMRDANGKMVPANAGGALETVEAIVDVINAVDWTPVSSIASVVVNAAQGDLGGVALAAAGMFVPAVDAFKGGRAAATLFKTEHYASRLEKVGVSITSAERDVRSFVDSIRSSMVVGSDVRWRWQVDGRLLEYRARLLPNGSVNVGTIHPVYPLK